MGPACDPNRAIESGLVSGKALFVFSSNTSDAAPLVRTICEWLARTSTCAEEETKAGCMPLSRLT